MMNGMSDLIDLWKRQTVLAGGFAAMGPAAGFVIATRLAQMATQGGSPSVAGMRETERMVSEKFAAVFEGGMAASRELARLPGATSPTAAASVMVAAGEAALKPARRTLKANTRRLSRL